MHLLYVVCIIYINVVEKQQFKSNNDAKDINVYL